MYSCQMVALFDRDRLDNVHPALPRLLAPGVPSSAVADDAVVPVRLLGEDWAVARIGGRLAAFVDRCPHRMAPLSAGTRVRRLLQCAYHGYRFGRRRPMRRGAVARRRRPPAASAPD